MNLVPVPIATEKDLQAYQERGDPLRHLGGATVQTASSAAWTNFIYNMDDYPHLGQNVASMSPLSMSRKNPIVSGSGAGMSGEFKKWLEPVLEPVDVSEQQKLYNALAEAKILVSSFAMYLDDERRRKLFRQLDALHDPDEMETGDAALRMSSFGTFLRAILYLKPKQYPALGMSHRGDLIGAWTEPVGRLTIEFRPADEIQWVLSRRRAGRPTERAAGDTTVDRLPAVLAPYQPADWFELGDAEANPQR